MVFKTLQLHLLFLLELLHILLVFFDIFLVFGHHFLFICHLFVYFLDFFSHHSVRKINEKYFSFLFPEVEEVLLFVLGFALEQILSSFVLTPHGFDAVHLLLACFSRTGSISAFLPVHYDFLCLVDHLIAG